jgi:hypothetical protein
MAEKGHKWNANNTIPLLEAFNTYRHTYFAQTGRDVDFTHAQHWPAIIQGTIWPLGSEFTPEECIKKFATLKKTTVRFILTR